MGHDHHRGAALGDLAHGVEHLYGELGVQCARGLVEEDDVGVERHGARYGHALLLAARELGGVGIELVAHADEPKLLAGLLLGLLSGDAAARAQPFGDVAENGPVPEQVVVLEHEAGALADLRDLAVGHRRQVVFRPEERERARLGALEEVGAAQKRGLPGARWPDDSRHRPLPYGQVDPVQDFGAVERLTHASKLEQGDRPLSSPSRRACAPRSAAVA